MKIALAKTKDEIIACHPVMSQLRPHLDSTAFVTTTERMKNEGYQLVYLADPDIRAVAGFRKMEMLATGPILYVDDLVTSAAHRSKGYGKHLLEWLLDEAKKQNCKYLELDSGLPRLDAHRFYERHGMSKAAFHFSIPATAAKQWSAQL